MKTRSIIALAILLAVGLGGWAWFGHIHKASRIGHKDLLTDSLQLRSLEADWDRSTNLAAVGDWSQPVQDSAGYTLRGRLLLFGSVQNSSSKPRTTNAPLFLELQNLSPDLGKPPAVYFAVGDGLECELRDAQGKLVTFTPGGGYSSMGNVFAMQYWATIPFDGSVRLRACPKLVFSTKPNGLPMFVDQSQPWTVPADGARYYFSGNFSPPTNHPVPPESHVWHGKIVLPPMTISIPKQ